MESMTTRALLLLTAAVLGGWGSQVAVSTSHQEIDTVFASDLDLDMRRKAEARNAIWMHPGPRNLDAAVFGTVANPLGTEFMIGVPLYDRLDDGQGNWTTTALPNFRSNNTSALGSDAVAEVTVRDRTPVDLPSFTSVTYDEIDLTIKFTDPFGRLLEVTCNKALPKGPFHEFFGGVGTNLIQHGRTGLGGKQAPQVFSYISLYGLAQLTIDGALLPGNDRRLIHVMVTQGIRDANNDPGSAGGNGPFMGTNTEVNRDDLELHMVLPSIRFMPSGMPQPNSPVVGVGQEYIHVLFEDVTLSGTGLKGVIRR